MIDNQRVRGKTKGYTLLEILVAATLGAIIVTIGLLWAGGIGRIAINAAASSDIGQVEIAFNRLNSDLINSTHCDPNGKDAKIRHIEKTKIGVLTKNADTSSIGVAWWRLSDNQLQRGWSELDASTCESSEPVGWSTLATNIGSDASGFYPVYSGESLTSYSPISCLLKFEEGCDIPGVSTYLYSNISRQGFGDTVLLNSPTAGSSGLIYEEQLDFTNVQRPGKVENVTVQVFDTALRLSWDAPSANLGTIEDYYIQYKESSSDSWSLYRDGLSSGTSAVVTNLTNGSGYDFKVASVNEKGTGLYSEQVSGTPVLFAEGGVTSIVESGNQTYRVHAYTSVGNNTFTANIPLEVDYLIVGGGGGGGSSAGAAASGGGGGAGGLLTGDHSLTVGSFAVQVGSGGAGASAGVDQNGGDGADSSAFGFTAQGGGGGQARDTSAGRVAPSGGSGGGGGSQKGLGGPGVTGQGNAGGDGNPTTLGGGGDDAGGGGGGAGSVGGDAVNYTNGGDGGDGVLSSITGTSILYAGGGGGGISNYVSSSTVPGAGGSGGGGVGGKGNTATMSLPGDGVDGSGGGGGGAGGTNHPGGDGGSGIVIIRYPIY